MKKSILTSAILTPSIAAAHPGHLDQWIHGEMSLGLLAALGVVAVLGICLLTGMVSKSTKR